MITNNLMKRPNGKRPFIVQLDKMEDTYLHPFLKGCNNWAGKYVGKLILRNVRNISHVKELTKEHIKNTFFSQFFFF